MSASWPALAASILWGAITIGVAVRFLRSRSLDEYKAPDRDAPTVSVIVPARDEAHNIGECLRSVLTSRYAALEVIVVDDHSTDGTGAIARALAEEDSATQGRERLRVVDAPTLPEGWFGKQWACHTGAALATGTILCFTDADTRHAPDLLGLSVGAMQERRADLFSVAGHQEAVTFWEKVVQPFVFSLLLSRFGGLETMSRSTRPIDKIANGQFVMLTREAYTHVGGHEAVREHVAEDLRLAQLVTARGLSAQMVLARDHLRTRMYASLAEIRSGWGKNVYAAGRDTLPLGPLSSRLLPWIFPLPALLPLLPLVILALALLGRLGADALFFGVVGSAITLLYYACVYAFTRLNPLWALSYPLAALVFGWICAEAAWRGNRVQWKGRAYLSRTAS